MGSVGISWSGTCLPGPQDELLSFLARLAEKNDELLQECPPSANEFALFDREFMTPRRHAALRSRPNVERVERVLSGPIEIDSSVFADYREFADGAEQIGLPILGAEGRRAEGAPFVLNLSAPSTRRSVRLKRASIYGINFRLFGTGYPGEDRVSFVFLHCPEILFLDGRIVEIFHRTESPGLIRFETITGADWYAQAPEVHLRYYLEDWFNLFLSWVKFFFAPNFHWWNYEPLLHYDRIRPRFEELQANAGTALARTAIFEDIMRLFSAEAAPIAQWKAKHRRRSVAQTGFRGRVLRGLRQSGDAEIA